MTSSSDAEVWFTAARPSIADPVLHLRLARFFEGRDAAPSEDARRSVVFDLVTGSCGAAEALGALGLGPEAKMDLTRSLERRPPLAEIREALTAVGRQDEAATLTEDSPLGGGELETRLGRQRSGGSRVRAAPSGPTPAPAPPTPAFRAPAASSDEAGRPAEEPGRAPPAADALELRALRASIERLEARVDHALSLLRLASLAAVGALFVLALWAVLD